VVIDRGYPAGGMLSGIPGILTPGPGPGPALIGLRLALIIIIGGLGKPPLEDIYTKLQVVQIHPKRVRPLPNLTQEWEREGAAPPPKKTKTKTKKGLQVQSVSVCCSGGVTARCQHGASWWLAS